MKLIEDWQNKKLKCAICGTTRSVKYQTEIYNPIESNKPIQACVCNKCVLRISETIEQIGE